MIDFDGVSFQAGGFVAVDNARFICCSFHWYFTIKVGSSVDNDFRLVSKATNGFSSDLECKKRKGEEEKEEQKETTSQISIQREKEEKKKTPMSAETKLANWKFFKLPCKEKLSGAKVNSIHCLSAEKVWESGLWPEEPCRVNRGSGHSWISTFSASCWFFANFDRLLFPFPCQAFPLPLSVISLATVGPFALAS